MRWNGKKYLAVYSECKLNKYTDVALFLWFIMFSVHKKAYFSYILSSHICKMCVSEHFFFAKIIHPPARCGTSWCWLNSMVVAGVPCAALNKRALLNLLFYHTTHCCRCWHFYGVCKLRIAGTSTRPVVSESNIHFSTIDCLQFLFQESGSTSNQNNNHIQHVTTSDRTSTSCFFTCKII